jgi:DNA modification methylase
VPKPYYADDLVTLYHGDCREIDAWLQAGVLITDPPYGMAYDSSRVKGRTRPIAGDTDTNIRDAALAMWGSRPAAVFGTWRAPRPSATRQVLVWDKTDGVGPGMGDLSSAFGTSHEEIYLLGEWRKVGPRRGSVIRTGMAMGNPNGLIARAGHPSPKPVGLMEQIVVATQGVVADPFAGSGSTLVAARQLGRPVIGVEVEERYCEITARRLAQGVLDFGAAGA